MSPGRENGEREKRGGGRRGVAVAAHVDGPAALHLREKEIEGEGSDTNVR